MTTLRRVFLAIDSKEPDFADTLRGKMVAGSELVFLVLFCIEMCIKIVGLGFAWVGLDTTCHSRYTPVDDRTPGVIRVTTLRHPGVINPE
jgi:hypothetical protein